MRDNREAALMSGTAKSGVALDASGPAQPSGGWAKRGFVLALLLATAGVGVAEYSRGHGVIPVAWLSVGPLLASLVLSPWITAAVAGSSVLLGGGLRASQPVPPGSLISRLSVLLLLAGFAVANAVLRTAAQRRLSQVRAVARGAQSALLREVPATVTAGRLASRYVSAAAEARGGGRALAGRTEPCPPRP